MNRSLCKSLSYDPVNDFTPVSLTSWGTLLLVTNPNVQKAATVAQLVKCNVLFPFPAEEHRRGCGHEQYGRLSLAHLGSALLARTAWRARLKSASTTTWSQDYRRSKTAILLQ